MNARRGGGREGSAQAAGGAGSRCPGAVEDTDANFDDSALREFSGSWVDPSGAPADPAYIITPSAPPS